MKKTITFFLAFTSISVFGQTLLPKEIEKLTNSTNYYEISSLIDSVENAQTIDTNIRDNEFKRKLGIWKKIYSQRIATNGELKHNLNSSPEALRSDCGTINANWIEIGPKKDIGNQNLGWVNAICPLDTFPKKILLSGYGSGGIFKTIDGGKNWYNVTDSINLSRYAATSFAHFNLDTNIVFATLNNDGMMKYGNGNGVYYSLNQGDSWHATGLTKNLDTHSKASGIFQYLKSGTLLKKVIISKVSTSISPVLFAITNKRIYTNLISRGNNANAVVDYKNPSVPWIEIYKTDDNIIDITEDSIPGCFWIATDKKLIYFNINLYSSIPSIPIQQVSKSYDSLGLSAKNINNLPTKALKEYRKFIVHGNKVCLILNYDWNSDQADDSTLNTLCQFQFLNNNIQFIHQAFFPNACSTNLMNVNSKNLNRLYFEGSNLHGARFFRKVLCSVDSANTLFFMDSFGINHVDTRLIELFNENKNQEKVLVGNDGGISFSIGQSQLSNINGKNLSIVRNWNLKASQDNSEFVACGAQDGSNYSILKDQIVNYSDAGDGFNVVFDEKEKLKFFTCINNGLFDFFYDFPGNLHGTGGSAPLAINRGGLFIGFPFRYSHESNLISKVFYVAQSGRDLEKIRTDFLDTTKIIVPIQSFPNLGKKINLGTQSLQLNSVYRNYTKIRDYSSDINAIETYRRDTNYLVFTRKGGQWRQDSDSLKISNFGGVFVTSRSAAPNSSWNFVDVTYNLLEESFNPYSNSPLNSGAEISYLKLNQQDKHEMWVSMSGFSDTKKVYHLNGNVWDNISGCLPNIPVFTLEYDTIQDILYAGTDNGLYYAKNPRGNNVQWIKMEGAPSMAIFEISYQYCSNKLYVATWGRGLWEVTPSFPEFKINLGSAYTIPAGVTKEFNSDITVEGMLKVNGTLLMSKGTKIWVKSGAILEVSENAHIKNRCDDGEWNGIIVEGQGSAYTHPASNSLYNFTTKQFNPGIFGMFGGPGVVLLRPGSSIRNAKSGIYSGSILGDWDNTRSGGIIIADSALFFNNERAIGMVNYESKNASYFKNCRFEWNDFIDRTPEALVTMWAVNGIVFEACNFIAIDLNRPHTDDIEKGTAIKAVDANFKVIPSCTKDPLTDGCIETLPIKRSTFTNFYRGIDASGSMLTKVIPSFKLYYGRFVNNQRGVYAMGLVDPSITYSNFYNEARELGNLFLTPFGHQLYLSGCQKFSVEQDSFIHINTTIQGGFNDFYWPHGLLIAGSNQVSSNVVKNNYFFNHLTAAASIGTNGSNLTPIGAAGLLWNCNSFEENYSDINLFYGGACGFGGWFSGVCVANDPAAIIHPQQGQCASSISNPEYKRTSTANNIFTQRNPSYNSNGRQLGIFSSGLFHRDAYNDNQATAYQYTYPNPLNHPQLEPLATFLDSYTKLVKEGCSNNFFVPGQDANSSCPKTSPQTKFWISAKAKSLKGVLNEVEQVINNQSQLQAYWLGQITGATASAIDDIIDALIDMPYVTESLLDTIIQHPYITAALPQLKELLLKNSGLEASVIDNLIQEQIPYTTSELEQLINAQILESPNDYYKNRYNVIFTQRQIKIDELARFFVDSNQIDSAIQVFLLDSSEASFQQVIPYLLSNERYQDASQVMNYLKEKNPVYYGPIQSYYNFIIEQKGEGKSYMDFGANQTNELKDFAENGQFTSYQAVALLEQVEQKDFIEPIPNLPAQSSLKRTSPNKRTRDWWKEIKVVDRPEILVYPNPANDYIKIEYFLYSKSSKNHTIKILDILGRVVYKTYESNKGSIFKELNISSWKSGLYRIIIEDELLGIKQSSFIKN